MAYNNGFPVGYQPAQIYYPQPYQQSVQQVQQAPQMPVQQQTMTPPTIHAEIIQVENEDAVSRFPLAAGTSQMFITRDDSMIIVKTMYANGQYNIDVFVKRPQKPKQPEIDTSVYVTREEFESRLKAITEPLEGKQTVRKKEAKKEGEE